MPVNVATGANVKTPSEFKMRTPCWLGMPLSRMTSNAAPYVVSLATTERLKGVFCDEVNSSANATGGKVGSSEALSPPP